MYANRLLTHVDTKQVLVLLRPCVLGAVPKKIQGRQGNSPHELEPSPKLGLFQHSASEESWKGLVMASSLCFVLSPNLRGRVNPLPDP